MAAAASAGATLRANPAWWMRPLPGIVHHRFETCGSWGGTPTDRGCPGSVNATQPSPPGRHDDESRWMPVRPPTCPWASPVGPAQQLSGLLRLATRTVIDALAETSLRSRGVPEPHPGGTTPYAVPGSGS